MWNVYNNNNNSLNKKRRETSHKKRKKGKKKSLLCNDVYMPPLSDNWEASQHLDRPSGKMYLIPLQERNKKTRQQRRRYEEQEDAKPHINRPNAFMYSLSEWG